jgi:TusA-related sulfurtransferase
MSSAGKPLETFEYEVNACGLNCPMPVRMTKKALAGLQPGEMLRVRTTDYDSLRDLIAFCEVSGDTMVSQETVGNEFVHIIRKN